MGVGSLGQEDPLEEDMATHSSILPGESCEQGSLKESDMTETEHTHTQTLNRSAVISS